jgi:hypothetical protein
MVEKQNKEIQEQNILLYQLKEQQTCCLKEEEKEETNSTLKKWYLELKFEIEIVDHDGGYCTDTECEYKHEEYYVYPTLPDIFEKKEGKYVSLETYKDSYELYELVASTNFFNSYTLKDKSFSHSLSNGYGFVVSLHRCDGSGYCSKSLVPKNIKNMYEVECGHEYWRLIYIKIVSYDE